MTDETFELEVDEIKHESERAVLVVIDGDDHWIPKSQIKDQDGNTFTITEWIAKQKGFLE